MSETNPSNDLSFDHENVAEKAKDIVLVQAIFDYLTKKYREINLTNEEAKIKRIISEPQFLDKLKQSFKNGFNPNSKEDQIAIAPFATSIMETFQKMQIKETKEMIDEQNQKMTEKYQTKKDSDQKNTHEQR